MPPGRASREDGGRRGVRGGGGEGLPPPAAVTESPAWSRSRSYVESVAAAGRGRATTVVACGKMTAAPMTQAGSAKSG